MEISPVGKLFLMWFGLRVAMTEPEEEEEHEQRFPEFEDGFMAGREDRRRSRPARRLRAPVMAMSWGHGYIKGFSVG